MVRPFRDIAAGRKRAGYCASRRATTHVRTRHRGTADICAFETFGRRLESVESGCGAVSGRPAPSFPRIAQCSRALRPARSRSPTTQRLQPFRHHHDFRLLPLERLPGGACTHWKAPCHDAQVERAVSDRGPGRRSWGRVRVASGRTGFRARATLPSRARSRFHYPTLPYAKLSISACASAISGISAAGAKPSRALLRMARASAGRAVAW